MFSKYNDNLAAICLGIYFLGCLGYVVQLIFTTEAWLVANEIDTNAVTVARVLGSTWLGIVLGLFLTFMRGPDGQGLFFWALGVAQIATLATILHSHFVLAVPTTADDAAIVSVLTLLFLIGFFRIKSRL
ncbi:MAG: hypothetical protein VX693_12655 [Pseudomonadota bacterium]|nr:hypothetical protein [Pseudomonadota bacterium]